MLVIQVAGIALCIYAAAINMRAYRQWKRDLGVARTAHVVVAQLLARSRAWLECDRCGGRLDTDAAPDRPACLELDDHDRLHLLCSSCAADRT